MSRLRNNLKRVEFLRSLYSWILFKKNQFWFNINPKKVANIQFKKIFKRDINWVNPRNLIEKIYWMLFNSDTSNWSKLADKYAVREYINEKGYGHILNDLYGCYDNAESIDFNSLPNEFVIKTNNACETVILVKDKSKLNIKKTKKTLTKWLKRPFGVMDAQIHYLKIPPKIIVEKFLFDKKDHSKPLIDYKFMCFYGKPECILIVTQRDNDTHSYVLNLYDTNWVSLTNNLSKYRSSMEIPKPKSFDEMMKACHILAAEFPEVRVDFYEIDGKPIFGEFTFTTGYGYYTNEFYDYLGSKIDLEKMMSLSNV